MSPFLDDATVGPDGQFLNPDGLAAKRVELGVHVITNPTPSVFCKRLRDITMQPTLEQMTQVAVEAFGEVESLRNDACTNLSRGRQN